MGKLFSTKFLYHRIGNNNQITNKTITLRHFTINLKKKWNKITSYEQIKNTNSNCMSSYT